MRGVEVGISQIEAKSERYNRIHIHLVGLAKVDEIFKQVLLVRELLVKFEMVEGMPEHSRIHAIVVIVTLAALLPPHVYEKILAVGHLLPVFASRQHPVDDRRVVPRAHEVPQEGCLGLQYRLDDCAAASLVSTLSHRGITFRMIS